MSKDGKIVKVVLPSVESFNKNKEYLIQHKADFQMLHSGNVDSLVYNGREFIGLEKDSFRGLGHHLSKAFLRDVDKWLEVNAESMERWDKNYKEQMFNMR